SLSPVAPSPPQPDRLIMPSSNKLYSKDFTLMPSLKHYHLPAHILIEKDDQFHCKLPIVPRKKDAKTINIRVASDPGQTTTHHSACIPVYGSVTLPSKSLRLCTFRATNSCGKHSASCLKQQWWYSFF